MHLGLCPRAVDRIRGASRSWPIATAVVRALRETDRSLRRSSFVFSSFPLFLSPRRDAPQEARVALNILTGSKLVVKRIASKETKNPRVPVDGDALVAEVRFQSRSRLARSPLSFFFFPRGSVAASRSALFFAIDRNSRSRRAAFAAHDEILSPESMRLLLN